MKIACVHDWLVSIGGGEKALSYIHEIFPGDLFALFHQEEKMKGSYFEGREVRTSFLQKMPFAKKKYQSYLPFFPVAIENFDLSDYDLVISSSHCAAKGVMTHIDQLHICYCYTPVRYAWDLYHTYLNQTGLNKGIKSLFAKMILHYFRMWDHTAAGRVDEFIGISRYVVRRIEKIYGRKAKVIYPGVDTDFYQLTEKKEDYYLTASRLVPYKRIDLIVEAFSKMPDKKLIVVGDGPEMKTVKAKAKKNIEILGRVSDDELKKLMGGARAFVFAALEDFGILPVEAQSAGTPVIAFGKGGSLETVGHGVFFYEQTVKAIIDAVKECERKTFDPKELRAFAEKFSIERFQEEFKTFVMETWHARSLQSV